MIQKILGWTIVLSICIGVVIFFGWMIITAPAWHNDMPDNTDNHKPVKKWVQRCNGSVQFFDSTSHSLKRIYSDVNIILPVDSLLSFAYNGNVIDSNFFIGDFSINDNDKADITLKNGKHFTVDIISYVHYSGHKLDSLKRKNHL